MFLDTVKALIGILPGGGTINAGIEASGEIGSVIGGMYQSGDNKKTGTWLDKLSLDDELSAIVDDTVESGFINDLIKRFKQKDPNERLPADFNINTELMEYLRLKYEGRSVTV